MENAARQSFQKLYVNQLKDLYSAEKQLIAALPKMANAAYTPALQAAFINHLKETEIQKERLENLLAELGERPDVEEVCEAMEGIVKEGKEMIESEFTGEIRDAGLIGAAQKIEHYEIAGYGTVRYFAELLGDENAVALLSETLQEEKHADRALNELATGEVNEDAVKQTPQRRKAMPGERSRRLPKKWTNKDKRQYEHIKSGEKKYGRSARRAKQIAAATVNKQRGKRSRSSGRKAGSR